MNIILIAAIGKNNELGKDNKLLWHLPQDLKFFKEKTRNKTIVMGRLTFESLPGILPNRNHVVISHQDLNLPAEVKVLHDINTTISYLKTINDDIYIIGGASIYKEFIKYANKIYLTEIDASKAADTFFPEFNKNDYIANIIDEINESGINYKHIEYTRR